MERNAFMVLLIFSKYESTGARLMAMSRAVQL